MLFRYLFGKLKPMMCLIALAYVSYALAACNVCQENQVACMNSTSYYLCFGKKEPDTSYLYHCENGFDCTDLKAICVQSSSQRRPSCGDTSLCDLCSAHRNYVFACRTRTTFQMCYGANRPIGRIGRCPSGYVCDSSSDAICVLENNATSNTCNIVDNEGMTSPPTTTTETQMCEQQRSLGLYPPTPNDPSCKRYVSCYLSNGIMMGREYNCPFRTYFHIQQVKCDFNKPSYCM